MAKYINPFTMGFGGDPRFGSPFWGPQRSLGGYAASNPESLGIISPEDELLFGSTTDTVGKDARRYVPSRTRDEGVFVPASAGLLPAAATPPSAESAYTEIPAFTEERVLDLGEANTILADSRKLRSDYLRKKAAGDRTLLDEAGRQDNIALLYNISNPGANIRSGGNTLRGLTSNPSVSATEARRQETESASRGLQALIDKHGPQNRAEMMKIISVTPGVTMAQRQAMWTAMENYDLGALIPLYRWNQDLGKTEVIWRNKNLPNTEEIKAGYAAEKDIAVLRQTEALSNLQGEALELLYREVGPSPSKRQVMNWAIKKGYHRGGAQSPLTFLLEKTGHTVPGDYAVFFRMGDNGMMEEKRVRKNTTDYDSMSKDANWLTNTTLFDQNAKTAGRQIILEARKELPTGTTYEEFENSVMQKYGNSSLAKAALSPAEVKEQARKFYHSQIDRAHQTETQKQTLLTNEYQLDKEAGSSDTLYYKKDKDGNVLQDPEAYPDIGWTRKVVSIHRDKNKPDEPTAGELMLQGGYRNERPAILGKAGDTLKYFDKDNNEQIAVIGEDGLPIDAVRKGKPADPDKQRFWIVHDPTTQKVTFNPIEDQASLRALRDKHPTGVMSGSSEDRFFNRKDGNDYNYYPGDDQKWIPLWSDKWAIEQAKFHKDTGWNRRRDALDEVLKRWDHALGIVEGIHLIKQSDRKKKSLGTLHAQLIDVYKKLTDKSMITINEIDFVKTQIGLGDAFMLSLQTLKSGDVLTGSQVEAMLLANQLGMKRYLESMKSEISGINELYVKNPLHSQVKLGQKRTIGDLVFGQDFDMFYNGVNNRLMEKDPSTGKEEYKSFITDRNRSAFYTGTPDTGGSGRGSKWRPTTGLTKEQEEAVGAGFAQ